MKVSVDTLNKRHESDEPIIAVPLSALVKKKPLNTSIAPKVLYSSQHSYDYQAAYLFWYWPGNI